MDYLGPALLIFVLRVTDVSIGTLRMLYAMRGRRLLAAGLGLIESGVFIFAISSALAGAAQDPWKMVGYALGFATGTYLGMTLESWIASGTLMARIISKHHSHALVDALHVAGFGFTSVEGRGRELAVLVVFVVFPRKRAKELTRVICNVDADAFVTTANVNTARGGYLSNYALPDGVRK